MTLKAKIVEEINQVDPVQLHLIYELIINLQNSKRVKKKSKISPNSHLKVRSALNSIRGSLSHDISQSREDRF
ncbi:MAG: hypothetical protein SFU98_05185 [Leptospiraceae bacterium]|nr:hypothetical protein [Leptospiraceae bacterium]